MANIVTSKGAAAPSIVAREAYADHVAGIEVSVISPVYDEEDNITSFVEHADSSG